MVTQDIAASNEEYIKITEAYEVLSDPVKKAFVDLHGSQKLKEGFFVEGVLNGGYHYSNDP